MGTDLTQSKAPKIHAQVLKYLGQNFLPLLPEVFIKMTNLPPPNGNWFDTQQTTKKYFGQNFLDSFLTGKLILFPVFWDSVRNHYLWNTSSRRHRSKVTYRVWILRRLDSFDAVNWQCTCCQMVKIFYYFFVNFFYSFVIIYILAVMLDIFTNIRWLFIYER